MRRGFMLAVLLVAVAVGSSWGADKVVTAVGDPWPPFGDPEKPSQGLAVEIVREAMKTQGYKLEMSFMPWARAEDGVKKGTYDFLLYVWLTDARKSSMLYSDPYGENRLVFLKSKGSDFEYHGIDSLKDLTIGVVRDYGYGDKFMNAQIFKRDAAPDFITNAKKLVAGRVDLTLEDEIVAKDILARAEMSDQVDFTENALSVEPLHVTIGLENPRHAELIEAFNKGLGEIRENGTYDRILADYGLK